MSGLKQMILEMSPQALEDVLDAIRNRPDIVSVEVVTGKDLEDMNEEHERHFKNLFGAIREERKHESA